MTTPVSDATERAWRPGRVLVIVVIVAMVAMWAYVLYLAFGPGRQPPPDRLADPTFARAAQERCEEAHADVAGLPRAVEAKTATERARIVDVANDRFSAMIDEIEPLAPAGDDGEVVHEWIADWRTYLEDRASYADALRSDPDARLFVTARENEQVTEYIDAFAADNHMAACATPIDV
ncbi:MAG: hypothetical protein ACJ739_05245 [Acidimicrobiales bacterium]